MNSDLVEKLACPHCGKPFNLRVTAEAEGEIREGELACTGCGRDYPIIRFIPRFVSSENYSSSFGFQWQRFRRTQLDSSTGRPIARDRFFAQSGWSPTEMDGAWTLDVGCGAGRFAEVVLGTGARLVAVDYSTAVDACRANLAPHRDLDVIQADVYRLPFPRAHFEFVYCFGVLQHTPDVHEAFRALSEQVRCGGRIAVDLYPRTPLNVLWPKYWIRPLTRRVAPDRLLAAVTRMVEVLWPVSLVLGRVPIVGRELRHLLPIANYDGLLPLTPQQLKEWAVLDTFDMLAPAHDHPQSTDRLEQWFAEARLTDVEVFRRGLVVGRGRQPLAPALESV